MSCAFNVQLCLMRDEAASSASEISARASFWSDIDSAVALIRDDSKDLLLM